MEIVSKPSMLEVVKTSEEYVGDDQLTKAHAET
jgi:hypothetical protein